MECEFCGEEISEGALACPRCGSPVRKREDSPAENEPAPAGAPVDGPPHVEGMPPGQTQANPEAPAEPSGFDVPLARDEEDFIAMAEEAVTLEEEGEVPSDISALADQQIPPGAKVTPEQVSIDDLTRKLTQPQVAVDSKVTGGYKGQEGPSVSGAGEQTEDDPFGLNITEKAPPVVPDWGWSLRGRNRPTPWMIAKTAIVLVVLAAVIVVGVYFGFMRNSGKSTLEGPADSLHEFVRLTTESDLASLKTVAVEGTPLIQQMQDILKPYLNTGILTLKSLDTKPADIKGSNATLEITKFEVEYQPTEGKGEKELIDVLQIKKPYPMPKTVTLIQKDGRWYINS